MVRPRDGVVVAAVLSPLRRSMVVAEVPRRIGARAFAARRRPADDVPREPALNRVPLERQRAEQRSASDRARLRRSTSGANVEGTAARSRSAAARDEEAVVLSKALGDGIVCSRKLAQRSPLRSRCLMRTGPRRTGRTSPTCRVVYAIAGRT